MYENGSLALKYKLDNEFELVFVVGYQKMLPLLYLDKLLDEIQLRFRNRFTSDLREKNFFGLGVYDGFTKEFMQTLQGVENKTKLEKEAKLSEGPRSYEQSGKSKKTVNSLIIDKNSNSTNSVAPKTAETKTATATSDEAKETPSEKELDEATRLANLSKLAKKKGPAPYKAKSPKTEKVPKKGKAGTTWGPGFEGRGPTGKEAEDLDRSVKPPNFSENNYEEIDTQLNQFVPDRSVIGESSGIYSQGSISKAGLTNIF